jgi:hypothetical protein
LGNPGLQIAVFDPAVFWAQGFSVEGKWFQTKELSYNNQHAYGISTAVKPGGWATTNPNRKL